MNGDVHVRFCERLGGRFPGATRLVCAFRYRKDAMRFYRTLPKRLAKFGLEVAPEKTQVVRFSRFHPSMKPEFDTSTYDFRGTEMWNIDISKA